MLISSDDTFDLGFLLRLVVLYREVLNLANDALPAHDFPEDHVLIV